MNFSCDIYLVGQKGQVMKWWLSYQLVISLKNGRNDTIQRHIGRNPPEVRTNPGISVSSVETTSVKNTIKGSIP